MMEGRGYAVVLDSILALTFILILFSAFFGLNYPKAYYTSGMSFKNLHYVSEDILDVLNKQGVLDQVGEAWAENNTLNAGRIASGALEGMVPANIGYRLTIDDELVIENTSRITEGDSLAKTHSIRLLVGYGKGLPTMGWVARGSLVNIISKITSSFVYFGGFEGEGNITKHLTLPATMISIRNAYMELAAGSSFRLYINGVQCGSTYAPSGGNMTANVKRDITSCNSSFSTGDNEIRIIFNGTDLSKQYVGGGFIELTYNVSDMDTSPENGSMTMQLPGIEGLINYYSSFYVPGDLNSMSIHLHFKSNYTTYLTIGNIEVFNSTGNASNQTIDLPDSVIDDLLNYDQLSLNTIPIRLGTRNISGVNTGNADVMLITDVSGSMDWQLNNSNGGVTRNCNDTQLYGYDTRRISLARCLDKEFVDTILNTTGNRVGLVGFNGNPSSIPGGNITTIASQHNLSTNNVSLKNQIDAYSPNGATGTCGAIRQATNMLRNQSNSSRQKYIIVMTDGLANVQCNPTNPNSTTGCIPYQCPTTSYCSGGGCLYQQCGDWVSDRASTDTVNASCTARSLLNATVHAVGFGPVYSCALSNVTLQNIAVCGNGSYYASSNATELASIYRNIAQEIVTASYLSQAINVSGLVRSILYPDSYIMFNYTSNVSSGYGEISVSLTTNTFDNCSGILAVPNYTRITEAEVTSYSSEHWTDYLDVYNSVGSSIAYTLRDGHFGLDYWILGDPYVVHIPTNLLLMGENNTLSVDTGDSPSNHTGCSPDDRAIYTVKIRGFVDYGGVFPRALGCIWDVDFAGYGTSTMRIPSGYNGTQRCFYTPGNISYDQTDAVNDAVYRMFTMFDFNGDGELDIVIDQDSMTFDFSKSGNIRSLWGPLSMKLILWM